MTDRTIDALRRAGLIVFFLLLLVVVWGATRLSLVCLERAPGMRLEVASPFAVSGDEPHFLIVINSILFDHDLELQDDYSRVDERGSLAAGRNWRFTIPDHHTIVVNRRTGVHATWFSLHVGAGGTPPLATMPQLRTPQDVYEVSSHPIAYPALIAAMIAPMRPTLGEVERDASVAMVLISWVTCVAVFFIARGTGMDRASSVVAVALLALASPWLPYARSYYSEPAIGLALVLGLWALDRERPVLAAFGVAAAAVLKPPYAVVGAGFVLESMWRRHWRDAGLMSLVLVGCGACAVGFNYWLASAPIIGGNVVDWSHMARDLRPLYASFLEPGHGLLVFAPWVIFASVGLSQALSRDHERSNLTRHMTVPLLLFFAVMLVVDVGPGACYGPRYWVPFLPWLALACAGVWATDGRWSRAGVASLAMLGAAIAISGVLRYAAAFSKPPWAVLFCAH